MIILKFLLFIFLFFMVLGLIGSIFLKLAFRKLKKNIKKNFEQDNIKESNSVNYSNTKTKKQSTISNNDGEYVDFEEIKD